MKKTFLLLPIFLLSVTFGFCQVDKEYSKTLKKMFQVSGSEESYNTVIKQMMEMYKGQYPEIDPEIWDELEKDFLDTSLIDLVDMLTPVYQKYMTKSDLEELIAFYESPVGKKYAESTPYIVEDSMMVGQAWGMKIGEDFIKRMEKKGY